MKKFFIMMALLPGLLFANNLANSKNPNVLKGIQSKLKETGVPDPDGDIFDKTEPMPPGPYPDPDPGHEKILCLSVGTTYYGGNILFYAFGHNGNMAASRSQNKCFNFGFYNCRIWWCNPVY